jgi:LmbE family N-acetylglucosaminyl deacetylase
MLTFEVNGAHGLSTVLVLGAHCDDIEIGCGGTLAKLARRYPSAKFVWVTFCSNDVREAETRIAARRILGLTTDATVQVMTFKESHLPNIASDVKIFFETSLKPHRPDLILTHARHDLHQDHRTINQLTWNTFRDHAIWEYEVLKFDGDLGVPNHFVPLTASELRAKVDMLIESFSSQHSRQWFTRDAFEALARIRGVECNATEGFAEAFYVRKLVMEI